MKKVAKIATKDKYFRNVWSLDITTEKDMSGAEATHYSTMDFEINLAQARDLYYHQKYFCIGPCKSTMYRALHLLQTGRYNCYNQENTARDQIRAIDKTRLEGMLSGVNTSIQRLVS